MSIKSIASKRIFDLCLLMTGGFLIFPILLFIALFVRIRLGSPVFFSQERPGLNGVPFQIYKFRTMTMQVDAQGNSLPDEQRLTTFGKFLRASSLDELPELLNVLKGDMSLVGPRPLLMEYLPLYSPKQARRHEVKPGITGWAQVNGRNAISWEEKFDLDVWYVDNRSLWLDLKILGLTILSVLKREGISHEGHATMEKFKGSKKEI
ncbi:MAG: sugar transferase [Nitrospirae bacterium]|nr:sugar transferase [Nitrospirota bacterium]